MKTSPERPDDQERRLRVSFPLLQGAHPAPPDQAMTPDRVAEILMKEEARDLLSSDPTAVSEGLETGPSV